MLRAAAFVCIAVLAWQTIERNRDFASEVSIWSDTVAKRPGNARAHLNLGLALLDAGRPDQAMAHELEALRIKPDYAQAHHSVGDIQLSQRRFADAAESYRRALEITPHSFKSHYRQGEALKALGRYAEAAGHFARVLELRPDIVQAQGHLEQCGAALERERNRTGSAP